MQKKTAQDLIEFSVQLHSSLRTYLEMDAWTPVMGAMLLAGIRPEPGCTEIPEEGGIGLDGTSIKGAGNTPFYEARKILQQWNDWCQDRGCNLTQMKPIEFIDWCVEDEIKERYAVHSPFRWVDVFKDMVGYPVSHVPFEVALYAAKTAQPLEVILDKLDEIDRRTLKATRRGAVAVVSVVSGNGEPQLAINPHRPYLTTEELAAALNLDPQTILKGRSKNGHYCGVKATKLPNRLLAWPVDAVERIMKGTPTDN
ncbi:hypothetical protein P3T20_004081 [Paraburkholderia sp. GAS206C]|uniref:hypothetical protein n=1 Tax=unclassified Paraburkholderia TaxID=2615204 RepID=UPI003D20C0A0